MKAIERLRRSAMNAFAWLACSLLTLALPFAAGASTNSARIARILIFDGGSLVYVYPVGGVVGAPACHDPNRAYYSFSLNRPHGKEYLSGMLAAQAQGATVVFYGSGGCEDQNVTETLSYFAII